MCCHKYVRIDSRRLSLREFFYFLLTYVRILYILFMYSMQGGAELQILIDNKSGAPIYEQIYTQLKEQIISGALEEDQPLPSIRGLAKDLRISVITTKRAYDELEQEGFLYTVAGKGSFVAKKNTALLREEQLKKIEDHLSEIKRLAATIQLSRNEIRDMLDLMWEDTP